MGKNRNLSEDEIKYIVSAETSAAQQEIHKLTKATSALKKEERERRKAMIELEAQGKKNTKEYQNLSKECKEYTNQISSNNKKIDEMRKKLDVNVMSMQQLKKQSKDLRTQLDNLSQALNPKEYAALEGQLQKVNERMGDLKMGAKNMAELAKSNGTLSVMFGNLFTKMAEWAGNTLARMKEIALEGVEMAASADGVTRAFRKMDDGTMLESLRKATKGTVNDLDLMKAAVQAKDFRIPLQNLGKYLQFAQLKAQQTCQSVEYMTQSIVTGLGRKSVMILDNLGLSAAEINEQVEKTGDFMSAVAAIVDKQLAAAGDNYVSAADRAMQKTVQFQNAQRELGETLLPLKEGWDSFYTDAQISTMQLIGWIIKHRAVLITLTSAVFAYIAAKKAQQLWTEKNIAATTKEIIIEKGKNAILAVSKSATLLYAAAKAVLTGNTTRATAAMKLFNKTTKMNALGLLVSLLATAATAYMVFRNKVSSTDKTISNFNTRLATEKIELDNLFNQLKKTNPGTQERVDLIKQLNDKYPDLLANYNLEKSNLMDITLAQNEANKALTNRIANEMKAEKISTYLKTSIDTQMGYIDSILKRMKKSMDKDVYATLESSMRIYLNDTTKSMKDFVNVFGKYADMGISEQAYFVAEFNSLRKGQTGMSDGIEKIEETFAPYIKTLKKASGVTQELSEEEKKKLVEESSLIKQLEKQKQTVQDTWKEDTKENISLKNKELERLDNEIKKYQELGRTKKKAKEKTDESSLVKEAQKDYQKKVESQKYGYQQDLNHFRWLLTQKKITQEQFSIYEAALKIKNTDALLEIEENYYTALLGLSARGEKVKEDTISQAAKNIREAEQSSFEARLSAEQTFQNNLQAMRDMIQAPEQKPEEKLKAQYDLQLSMLQSFYQASLEYAKKEGQDEAEVKRIYNEAKLSLDEKYQKSKEDLIVKSNNRIKGIEGNELSNYVADIWNTVADLQDIFNNFSDPDFWQNFGDQIIETMGKLVNAVTGALSSAFNTFQKIEMDNVEAKYNAEIEAAQGNSEEVERLEKEKAQKKLDIEKKYADIQFAIRASEIIANTAVAIMMCLRQLGPIAGPIMAGLMGATGAIQLAAANAERNKVKSMTLSSNSSSGQGTGARVATGREKGGKIDIIRAQDGKLFPDADYDPDARGFIDRPTVIVGEGPAGKSKEWVASNAAIENPTVAPFLQLLDAHQQAGDIATIDLNQIMRQRMAAGYVSGGSISTPVSTPATVPSGNITSQNTDESAIMAELLALLIFLKENGIPAYVVLSELEKKQELRDRARKIGSKS